MIKSTRLVLCRLATLAISGVLLCACGSRVSLDNYNKLKTGQSYSEVKAILGEATNCDELLGIRTCAWGDEKRGINANFVADKVLLLLAHNLD